MTDDDDQRGGRAVITVVLFGTLVGPLNSTMIAVALPRMASDLHVDGATMSWLVTAYLIAMAALQPVAGKLGDRLGRRPVLLGGYALFGVASALAAFVGSLPVLIVCRVVQAAAGALVMPTGMALLREAVPGDRLGRTLGLMGAIMPLAAAVGPVLGGVLVQFGGWQAIFLVNIPITLFTFVLGWYVIPHRPPQPGRQRFDLLGAAWLCALLIGLAALLDLTPGGLVLPVSCVALAVAAGVFIRYELRHPDAVLQPRLFSRLPFVAATGGVALANLAFYVTLLAVPLLLHTHGVSSGTTGLILGALTLAGSPAALAGGRLADRLGLRLPAVVGLVLIVAGLLPLVFVPMWLPLPLLAISLAIAGAGVGLSMPPFQLGAVRSVPETQTGAATGVFFTSRYLGSIAGTSLLAGPLAPSDGGSFTVLFAVLAMVAAAGVAVSAALPGRALAPASP